MDVFTAADGTQTLTARSQPGEPVTGDGAPTLVALARGDATGGATTAETGTDTDPVDDPTASSGVPTSTDTAVATDGAEPVAAAADDEDDDGGGGSAIVLVIVALVVAAAVVALVFALRGRSRRGGPPVPPGQLIYQAQCQACHGANRQGTETGTPLVHAAADPGRGAVAGAPSVDAAGIRAMLKTGRGRMPPFAPAPSGRSGVSSKPRRW